MAKKKVETKELRPFVAKVKCTIVKECYLDAYDEDDAMDRMSRWECADELEIEQTDFEIVSIRPNN